MPKGQFTRRTDAQKIADLEAQIAAIKAKASLNADNKAIKAIVTDINKAAKDLNVSEKEILKLVSSVVAPRQPKTKND
jgi:predicted site-specific integrase-resolvase